LLGANPSDAALSKWYQSDQAHPSNPNGTTPVRAAADAVADWKKFSVAYLKAASAAEVEGL